jgi:dTMP kinase
LTILLAIEGADGVGKNSAATRLCDELNAAGRSAVMLSFPRYQSTVGGHTLGVYLAGKLDVPVTPQAAAVLYALDRLESRDMIAEATANHEVVIFDRYIASNMAYQAARLPASEADVMMGWILALETGTFALPRPTLSIYLDTPWELARELILQKRQRSCTDRSYDEYEADVALQKAVRANYEAMVNDAMLGPWRVVHASKGGTMRAREAITAEIRSYLEL